MNDPVETPDEIIENIHQFNLELNNPNLDRNADIIRKLSYVRHWYYIPSLKLFGPNIFIAFKKNNFKNYTIGTEYGGDVVNRLKQWFDDKIGNIDVQWQELFIKLTNLLCIVDKKPNIKVSKDGNIHLPNQDFYKNLKEPLKS